MLKTNADTFWYSDHSLFIIRKQQSYNTRSYMKKTNDYLYYILVISFPSTSLTNMYSAVKEYCILPQAVDRRDQFSAACQHSVVWSVGPKSALWSSVQSRRCWPCESLYSSEAVSRYTLWRHHWLKPQPSPHTAPNDKREGEGCMGGGVREWRLVEG